LSTLQGKPLTAREVICFYCLGEKHTECLGNYVVDGASRRCVCCLRTTLPPKVKVRSRMANKRAARKHFTPKKKAVVIW